MSRGARSCGFSHSLCFNLDACPVLSRFCPHPVRQLGGRCLSSRPHPQTRAVCSATEGRGQWGPWPCAFSFCAHITGRLLQIWGRGRGRVLSQRTDSGARGVAAGWHRSCAFGAGDAGLGMKVSIDRIHPGSPGEPRACVTTRNSALWPETREDGESRDRSCDLHAATCSDGKGRGVIQALRGLGQARLCGGITRKASPSRASWLPGASTSKRQTGWLTTDGHPQSSRRESEIGVSARLSP